MTSNKIPIRSDFYDTHLDSDTKEKYLKFQINDIRDYHQEDDEQDTNTNKNVTKEYYTLKIFGCTINGSSVELTVTGYKSFFFIEVPNNFNETDRKLLLSVIIKKLQAKGIASSSLIKEKCNFFKCEKYAEFSNHTKFDFLRLCFDSFKVMRKCSFMFNYNIKFNGKNLKFNLFETDIEQLLKFIHIRNIEPAGWISIPINKLKHLTYHNHSNIDESIGYCDNPINISANVNHRDIEKYDTIDTAPFNRAGFDIECTSCDGGFPQFNRKDDPCIQIGTTYRKMGSEKSYLASVYTLKEPADIKYPSVDRVYVKYFHEEKDMLLGWAKHLRNMGPDFTYGYNNNGFDWEYIYMRCRKLGIHNRFLKILCKTTDDYLSTEYKEKQLNSSGLGDNTIKYIDIPGNVNIDILPVVRTDPSFKLPSYRLNAVLKYLGLDSKVDLSVRELFDKFERGKPEDIRDIAIYCIRDVESCHDLIDHKKLSIIPKAQGTSNVCSIPLSYNFLRGQGIRILSLVAKECMISNILIPKKQQFDKEPFKGARVIDPVIGVHTEPIVIIDYNSLYPSIIIGYNLCKTTKVIKGSKFDNLEGVDYRDLKYDRIIEDKKISKKCKILDNIDNNNINNNDDNDNNDNNNEKIIECRFVLPGKDNKHQGILPRICKQLLKARKETRTKMKSVTDQNVLAKLNSEQMAYKITCNSIYGQTGSQFSLIADKDLAPTVTSCGRDLLELAKDIAEKNYAATVVYGDSVTGDTPIICKLNDDIFIRTIDNLPSKDWYNPDNRTNKEFCNPMEGLLVWSDKGFTPIKTIIRHKTDKKIYRVTTHTGSVKVTEDHSLLDINSNEITPKDCVIGTKLLHHELPQFGGDKIIPEAWVWGFFYGDGSCGYYTCKSGNKTSWALNNQNLEYLKKAQTILSELYPDYQFPILETMKSSNVYKLVIKGNKIKHWIMNWRNLFYDSYKYKKIPDEIFSACDLSRKDFYEGYYAADGDKDINGYNRFDNKGEIGSAGLILLADSLDYKVSINTRKDKLKIYRMTLTKNSQRKDSNAIKKIEELPLSTDYVYDLETENHHFAAGVGKLIVHNTDSIFIDFNLQNIEDKTLSIEDNNIIKRTRAKELGDELSKEITNTINLDTIAIEYEKIFHPFISEQRKKYRGRKYEFDMTKFQKIEMGVESKKRDYAPILPDICNDLTDIVMEMKSYSDVLAYVRKRIEGVLQGDEPLDKFVITKSLKAVYNIENKNGAKISLPAHKVLANRMTKRDPGNAPRPSERLEYCFVVTPETFKVSKLKGGKLKVGAKESVMTGDMIEHISYIKHKNLNIDYPTYVDKQLMTSLVKLMMPVYLTECKNVSDPTEIPEPEEFIKTLVIEDYLAQQDPNDIERMIDDFKVSEEDELCRFKLDQLKKAIFSYNLNSDDYHYIDRVKKTNNVASIA
jgi:DNA polymerase elongation subunit (family B)